MLLVLYALLIKLILRYSFTLKSLIYLVNFFKTAQTTQTFLTSLARKRVIWKSL